MTEKEFEAEKQKFFDEDFGISEEHFLKLRDIQLHDLLWPSQGNRRIYDIIDDIRAVLEKAREARFFDVATHLLKALQKAEEEQYYLKTALALFTPLKKTKGESKFTGQPEAFLKAGGQLERYMTALVSDWWTKWRKLRPKHHYGACVFHYLEYDSGFNHDRDSWKSFLRSAKARHVQIDESRLERNVRMWGYEKCEG